MSDGVASTGSLSRQFRNLLPLREEQRGPGDSPPSFPPKVATSVKAACETCRKRKIKCSGERPRCDACVKRGAECHYDSDDPTQTKGQALKRKHGQLLRETQHYEQLYRLLQSSSERAALEIILRIRLGTDVQTLLRQIEEGDLPLQLLHRPDVTPRYEFPYVRTMPAALAVPNNPYIHSLLYENTASEHDAPAQLTLRAAAAAAVATATTTTTTTVKKQNTAPCYTNPYHVAEVFELRLAAVSASRWTSVISDDHLLRTLLQWYILYEYATYPAFQLDLFLDAMTGQSTTLLCSPLLVNAVLAEACHCSIKIPHREQFWNPHTLGYRFLAEARRLWELEAEKPDLTTLQAAIVLHIIYSQFAMDQIGRSYLERAVTLAHDLGLFKTDVPQPSREMAHARYFTAWCLFRWQATHGYYFARPSLISHPPPFALPDPDKEPSWYGNILLKYPSSDEPVSTHFGHVFKVTCELRIILNDLSQALFPRNEIPPSRCEPRLDTISNFLARLNTWFHNLCEPLEPKNIVLPCQITIHIEYQCLSFGLFQMWETQRRPLPNMPRDQLRGGSLQAVIRAETLARLYYLRHGYRFCDVHLAYLLIFLTIIILENTPEITTATTTTMTTTTTGARLDGNYHDGGDDRTAAEARKRALSSLILFMMGIQEQGRYAYAALVAARLLRERFTPEDLAVLDAHTTSSNHDGFTGEPMSPVLCENVRSQWPLTIIKANEDPKPLQLSELVSMQELADTSRATQLLRPNEASSPGAATKTFLVIWDINAKLLEATHQPRRLGDTIRWGWLASYSALRTAA
ncbi:hypothetical protein BX600DRAFT_554549 [Xylariales sp. PMI_506]|nr:hypothetical protein BX600DRAFT_554549 [Xylariales sp. PMI_506]